MSVRIIKAFFYCLRRYILRHIRHLRMPFILYFLSYLKRTLMYLSVIGEVIAFFSLFIPTFIFHHSILLFFHFFILKFLIVSFLFYLISLLFFSSFPSYFDFFFLSCYFVFSRSLFPVLLLFFLPRHIYSLLVRLMFSVCLSLNAYFPFWRLSFYLHFFFFLY